MMKVESVTFPQGLYGQKLRYLELGLDTLGVKTIVAPYVKRQIAVPIDIKPVGRDIIHAFLDVAVETGEVLENVANGENFYFKTHLDTRLMKNHRRLYPMPQALGHNEYLGMIDELRKTRRGQKTFACQVFGAFAYSDQRALACRIIKDSWLEAHYVGINKDRHPELRVPKPIVCDRLSFGKYLEEMSIAALALSFPSHKGFQGNGPWCSFRHVEAWALGVPIVTIPSGYYGILDDPAPFWFEVDPSLRDLVDVVAMALALWDRRKEFSERSIEYFEAYLRPEHHASYFLRTIENGIKGS